MLHQVLKERQAQFFLMYASSQNANFYYATGFRTYDPVLYLIGEDGTDLIVVPEMEKRRVSRESRVKEIASYEDLGYKEKLKELGDSKKALVEVIIELLKTHKARKLLLPNELPSFLTVSLMDRFDVEVIENPFRKLRIIKREDEIKKIKDTSEAILKAFDFTIRHFKFKTCEELRKKIEVYLYARGYLAEDTITSSGKLSADPHYIGFGEIEDHVVIDVFPKSRTHGYHSDFTRTVFVNKNAELEEMYDAVIEAQQRAIAMIAEGVDTKEVHAEVKQSLEDSGFKTSAGEGLIHSTGHGIGLEVHEEPRISDYSFELKKGMVVTVEPGLYYRNVGGVRVEDTVVVRKKGCEILTTYPKKILINI
jgi:Xaa-Pro aminopeptidase